MTRKGEAMIRFVQSPTVGADAAGIAVARFCVV
jgi:hypothetical protein